MRTLTIIFAAFFLQSNFLEGQEYIPFPVQNASWSIYLESTCDNDAPPNTFLLRYSLNGDTTINEKIYNKLFVARGDTVNPIVEPIGGIREEGKRVYYCGQGFLGNETEGELLLYDFNVQIKDTVYHSTNGFWKSVILDIDSVQIGERYRKRYKVNNGWFYHNPDYVIEGIGSVVNGLLGHISDIPTCGTHFWEHVCFTENGQVVFRNPTFSDCYAGLNVSSIESILERKTIIYPNPFSESIQIDNLTLNGSSLMQIFDSAGRLICENENTEINCQILIPGPAGIYFVLIRDKNGLILWEEIMIKE